MSILDIPTARVFNLLLEPSRYKAAYGGRGSGKSRFFGGLMVEEHARKPGMRSVCIREVQKSLKDSAKRLIEDRIKEYGLTEAHGFQVLSDVIKTPGGGIIIFQGMQDHTADSIKSLEGFDRAWVEEAQTLSERSLMMLRPTIRAPGSEIWFSWNPRLKSDPVDKMFRGAELPTGAAVVRANWDDNPWFPAELEQERLDCIRAQPEQYAHIWEGDYITVQAGAYYAASLLKAREQGRISHVAADPLMTIRTFWDIGGAGAKADACAIWVAQFVGREIRLLDYYEAQGQPLAAHVNWLRKNGYEDALCVLPHDGVQKDKVHAVSYESSLMDAGFFTKIIENQGAGAATARIEAARRLFPMIWFNETKCQAGLDALGWYHEKRDSTRNVGLGPDHDWSSHAADAFGMMCVAYEEPQTKRPAEYSYQGDSGWMG